MYPTSFNYDDQSKRKVNDLKVYDLIDGIAVKYSDYGVYMDIGLGKLF